MKPIPLFKPWITEREVRYVADAVRFGWRDRAETICQRFEQAFAERLGVAHAVALPTCSAAVALSLTALGVEPETEVVVPDLADTQWIAPVIQLGATPVLADVDPKTWCLSAASLESSITDETRAVLAVDLYGGMPAMDAIEAIARRNEIAVIEIAAEAFGSQLNGRMAGCFGDAGVFCFRDQRTLTTSEGGMLVTNDEALYSRICESRRPHGQGGPQRRVGNMTAMQAALGLAQLDRAEVIVERRRQIFAWYAEDLENMHAIALNDEPPDVANSYPVVTAVLDDGCPLAVETVVRELQERGISSQPVYQPISSQPPFAAAWSEGDARVANPVAYRVAESGFHLPSGPNITRHDVARATAAVREILNGSSAPRKAA